MMTVKYYVWNQEITNSHAGYSIVVGDIVLHGKVVHWLHEPRTKCVALRDSWDPDAVGLFFREEGKRTEHVTCTESHAHVVCQRVKDLLEPVLGTAVEFLPVTLRGQVTKDELRGYYFMHVLDCVRSVECEPNDITPARQEAGVWTQVGVCELMCLDDIPADARIFYTEEYKEVIIREDVFKLLKEAKVTGLLFRELKPLGVTLDGGTADKSAGVHVPDDEELTPEQSAIQSLLETAPSPVQAYQALCRICCERAAWDGWALAQKLDFECDVARLAAWLKSVFTTEPPSKRVKALWFGIRDSGLLAAEGGEANDDSATHAAAIPLPSVYLGGASQYEKGDNSVDWASDLDYEPKESDAPELTVPQELAALLLGAPAEVRDAATLLFVLGFFAVALRAALAQLDKPVAHKPAIAVGYDDGDWVWLVKRPKRSKRSQ